MFWVECYSTARVITNIWSNDSTWRITVVFEGFLYLLEASSILAPVNKISKIQSLGMLLHEPGSASSCGKSQADGLMCLGFCRELREAN